MATWELSTGIAMVSRKTGLTWSHRLRGYPVRYFLTEQASPKVFHTSRLITNCLTTFNKLCTSLHFGLSSHVGLMRWKHTTPNFYPMTPTHSWNSPHYNQSPGLKTPLLVAASETEMIWSTCIFCRLCRCGLTFKLDISYYGTTHPST